MSVDKEEILKEIWGRFAEQRHVFLATTDGDQPRLRPVMLIYTLGRLFVATGTGEAKVQQIKRNPKTEFCILFEKDGVRGSIRTECLAQIVEEEDVKTHIYNNVSFLKEFWGSPADPNYTLIELTPTGFEYFKPGSMQAVKLKP